MTSHCVRGDAASQAYRGQGRSVSVSVIVALPKELVPAGVLDARLLVLYPLGDPKRSSDADAGEPKLGGGGDQDKPLAAVIGARWCTDASIVVAGLAASVWHDHWAMAAGTHQCRLKPTKQESLRLAMPTLVAWGPAQSDLR